MANIINRLGEIHRNLRITEELGGGKVKCTCIKCNYASEYIKYGVINDKLTCKNCVTRIKDKTGEIHRELEIIEELGGKKIKCRCIKCGHIDDYYKYAVLKDVSLCNKCGIRIGKNRLGEIYRGLKIIKELGGNKVKCECNICGHIDDYYKGPLTSNGVVCVECGTINRCIGKSINNIAIIAFAYKGRDENRYYNCRCTKCGEELILTREEIIKYMCDKG